MAGSPRSDFSKANENALPESVEQAVRTYDETALWEVFHGHLTKKRTLSAHTLRAYRTGLTTYLRHLSEEGHPLSAPPALQTYADWLKDKEVAAATARSRLNVATQFLKVLRQLDALSAPPSLTVTLGALRPTQSTGAYTAAEVHSLLAHAHPEERIILQLVLEAGLTTGEIAALRREHVVLNDPLPYLVIQTEEEARQRVDLTPRLQQELNRWFSSTPVLPPSSPVTVGATQPYLDYTVKALCGRAGVPYKGLRALRVTAGARRYRETGDAHAVRSFLRLGPRVQISPYAEAAARLGMDPESQPLP